MYRLFVAIMGTAAIILVGHPSQGFAQKWHCAVVNSEPSAGAAVGIIVGPESEDLAVQAAFDSCNNGRLGRSRFKPGSVGPCDTAMCVDSEFPGVGPKKDFPRGFRAMDCNVWNSLGGLPSIDCNQ